MEIAMKAHCNTCGGDRNHDVLHSENRDWDDPENGTYGGDAYEMLRCCGCDGIAMRHVKTFSEWDDASTTYFPPPTFRPEPRWFDSLLAQLPHEEVFVYELLREVYVALQNGLRHLAAMGVRSLLERIMIAKVGDQGTFAKNLAAFEAKGFVSARERERLEAILEVGHATIHRAYSPRIEDVVTLVDITEHLVETVYLHQGRVEDLRKRVPPRSGPAPAAGGTT